MATTTVITRRRPRKSEGLRVERSFKNNSLSGADLDPPGLSEQALELAVRFNRPAAYAAHYLALAEHLGCPFWTADERLYNAVRPDLPYIQWLGDYRPER
jgi:predicted nucleic acid-binding protein